MLADECERCQPVNVTGKLPDIDLGKVGEAPLDIRVSPLVVAPEPVVKPPAPVVVMHTPRGEKILTADMVILGATYFEPPPKSKGFTILMLHDWNEDRTEEGWDHLARALLRYQT